MKALISKIEPRETGYRVAQVETDENVFPVAAGMEWVDCPDDLSADSKWYDPSDESFKEFPPAPEEPYTPPPNSIPTEIL